MLKFIILIVVVVAFVALLRFLRPRLREHRYEVWRREGLMPDQVDPPDRREE